MSFQLSTTIRNAQLEQIETLTAASAVLRFYTGAEPANCAAPATGTLLCSMPLPGDWMDDASAGQKVKKGIWTAQCVAAGTIGYFRLYTSTLSACNAQGNVTGTGGGGDMEIDNPAVIVDQSIVVNSFTLSAQNA